MGLARKGAGQQIEDRDKCSKGCGLLHKSRGWGLRMLSRQVEVEVSGGGLVSMGPADRSIGRAWARAQKIDHSIFICRYYSMYSIHRQP